MRVQLVAAALLVASACSSAQRPKLAPAQRSAAIEPTLQAMEVGKADLERARVLLVKARPEMEPRHWDLLDQKLLAAEHAWGRYDSLRPKGPRRSEASPALGLVGVGAEAVEGASLGPLLVLLAAVWSSSTASQAEDAPQWLGARIEYEASLRDLSEAATKVRLEIEASRGRRSKVVTSAPPPPAIALFEQASNQVAGEPPWRPCRDKGTGGPGPNSPRPETPWTRCTYQCGRYEVILYSFGRRSEVCKERWNLDRAEELARRFHG